MSNGTMARPLGLRAILYYFQTREITRTLIENIQTLILALKLFEYSHGRVDE